jgi:hypothetical protein
VNAMTWMVETGFSLGRRIPGTDTRYWPVPPLGVVYRVDRESRVVLEVIDARRRKQPWWAPRPDTVAREGYRHPLRRHPEPQSQRPTPADGTGCVPAGARRSPQEARSGMASTADIWTPHAAAEPPAPFLSLPVHRPSGPLRGDRGEGIKGAPRAGRTYALTIGAKRTVSMNDANARAGERGGGEERTERSVMASGRLWR